MQSLWCLALATLTLTACASSRPAAAPVAPTPSPGPVAGPPAPPSVPGPQRIDAGGWPGSNTHRWGSRSFEIRGEDTREVRIHDAIDFQGVGMAPHQMPPTSHHCTLWESLPSTVTLDAEAIRAWFRATEKPAPARQPGQAFEPNWTFGRRGDTCG